MQPAIDRVSEIKTRRRYLRVSQKALAHESGVSQSHIQKLESGTRKRPSYDVVVKLESALERLEEARRNQ